MLFASQTYVSVHNGKGIASFEISYINCTLAFATVLNILLGGPNNKFDDS